MAKLGLALGTGGETRSERPSEALNILEDQAKQAADKSKMRHIIV
jgi:hypothetical protein